MIKTATLAQTIEGLKNRQKGRLTGFKGEFTDLSGGEALEAFQSAVGVQKGFVDPHGQATPLAKEVELLADPSTGLVKVSLMNVHTSRKSRCCYLL